jgi:hypothetical protein
MMPMRVVRLRRSGHVQVAALLSFVLHAIMAIVAALYIAVNQRPDRPDAPILVELIEMPPMLLRDARLRKELLPLAEVRPLAPTTDVSPAATRAPHMIPEVVRRATNLVSQTVEVGPHRVSPLLPDVATMANLRSQRLGDSLPTPTSTAGSSSAGRGVETGRVRAAGGDPAKQGLSIISSTGVESVGLAQPKFHDVTVLLPDNRLGAVLQGKGRDLTGHIRIVRVKHALSDWWQDPTALSSFIAWLQDHTRIRADMKFEGGALPLDDDRILDSPLLILTGHDKDITVSRNLARGGPLTDGLSAAERVNLRRYLLDRGGMLFFDDCGFNGVFAEQIRQELRQVLPEYDLEDIPHNHELYTVYYELYGPPQGGDVFWGSENNPKVSPFRYHKGITINRRLVVVYNRKDYLCSMETTEIESRTLLRLRRSQDVYRFMTNVFVYTMKYGGNTDRSTYSSR